MLDTPSRTASHIKPSIEEPPSLELKPLPIHLWYALFDMNLANEVMKPNTRRGFKPQDLQDASLLSLDLLPSKIRTKNYKC
ncbi:hypothetical protein TIFTF001_028328 [Ficus carica]|uniref:Uncharacterized protein n=1 Tax=Ficus carica TaxID=3494 RepID=A0AA88J119_FICCA|nr:hypothetical protein TIFTF001_028328 [Ficus carica]